MILPSYFLADLPPEAALTRSVVLEAAQTLKKNRERYLCSRSTASIIRTLAQLARAWLEPEFPFRRYVLESGPVMTGFSGATLAQGLDRFFKTVTTENLHALLLQEFGHADRLDHLTGNDIEQKSGRAARVRGPELLVHLAAGNLPVPGLRSMIDGFLLRSAQFVKCATGSAFVPRVFAHSIYDADAKLGACLEIATWKGGTHALEEALFSEADCVTATGNDQTLEIVAGRLPRTVRLLGFGHRVSFAYIAHEALHHPDKIVARAALDVTAWNQLGCLSPHVIYVEAGGRCSPELFAEKLAAELDRLETIDPRGPVSDEESGAIATRRAFYEVRAAHSDETRLWRSEGSTAWTVIYEADPKFQISCLNRFIYVKAAAGLQQVLEGADAVRNRVSTVGLAAGEERREMLANQLAQWGAPRICPLGEMQSPPLSWRHDGRPALADLVSWSDWEQEP